MPRKSLGGTDLPGTILNMINCFIGAGILTVPFAFRLTGYGAVFGLALVAGLNWLTSLLLGRALEKASKLEPTMPTTGWDMPALARVAFGPIGEQAVTVFFALELWFALETFIVLIGVNVGLVTGLPKTPVIVAAGCLGTMSLSLPMSSVAGCSFLSLLCMVGGLATLLFCGSRMLTAPSHVVMDFHGMPSSIGIFLYCFSGLPCLPNIRASMRRPEQYSAAVHYAFSFAFLYYGAVGLLGYHFFGAGTRESFTANLFPERGLPDQGFYCCAALLSAGLFAVKLQAGFPLYAAPVLSTLGFGENRMAEVPASVWAARMAFGAISIAFAVFAQDALDAVAELMGAFLTNVTSIIFPCAAYAVICRASGERLPPVQAAGLLAMVVFGIVFCFVGTWSAASRLWTEKVVLDVAAVVNGTGRHLA